MTVKQFCEKYEISHQAVYAKIQKKADVLKGHISKHGCLVLDDFAVETLKPVSADSRFFKESEILKSELARKSKDFENLQSELNFKNEKIVKLENSLNDKTAEIEFFKNQLAEQNLKIEVLRKQLDDENSKNADLTKSVERLTDEIAEKLKQETERSARKSRGFFG
ncbi:MAG: hypothetical protein NC253_14850 [Ruminococcus sp.]|nr:hypothetical protein [Ruminococcus sp.]MCM1382288.1 hypothetical protein [Muribaculaceae bacterium]